MSPTQRGSIPRRIITELSRRGAVAETPKIFFKTLAMVDGGQGGDEDDDGDGDDDDVDDLVGNNTHGYISQFPLKSLLTSLSKALQWWGEMRMKGEEEIYKKPVQHDGGYNKYDMINFMRGARVFDAIMEDLLERGMKDASNVEISPGVMETPDTTN
ncbi:hypothetical protein LguiA_017829 [Lonicera macranthoides]